MSSNADTPLAPDTDVEAEVLREAGRRLVIAATWALATPSLIAGLMIAVVGSGVLALHLIEWTFSGPRSSDVAAAPRSRGIPRCRINTFPSGSGRRARARAPRS